MTKIFRISDKFVQFRRGLGEFVVLLLISKSYLPYHGKELMGLLNDTEFAMPDGTFYKTILTLKRAGLIVIRRDETDIGVRRCYYMTDKGEKYIKSLAKYWHLLSAQVASFDTVIYESPF